MSIKLDKDWRYEFFLLMYKAVRKYGVVCFQIK